MALHVCPKPPVAKSGKFGKNPPVIPPLPPAPVTHTAKFTPKVVSQIGAEAGHSASEPHALAEHEKVGPAPVPLGARTQFSDAEHVRVGPQAMAFTEASAVASTTNTTREYACI